MEKQSGEEFPISAKQGVLMIGFANAIPAWLSMTYVGKVGRRPIFITG